MTVITTRHTAQIGYLSLGSTEAFGNKNHQSGITLRVTDAGSVFSLLPAFKKSQFGRHVLLLVTVFNRTPPGHSGDNPQWVLMAHCVLAALD